MKENTEESLLDSVNKNLLNSTYTTTEEINSTVVHDGTEYHILEDGHYYYEFPGLTLPEPEMKDTQTEKDSSSDMDISLCRKAKLSFSTDPIRVIYYFSSCFSTDMYDFPA